MKIYVIIHQHPIQLSSATSTNNRKKRSISNEYDFSSNSMINDGHSLPKRFRPMQPSTGKNHSTERKNAIDLILIVPSRQLQVQECSSDDDDNDTFSISTRRILSSSSTTTNELTSSRATAAACIAAAVTASLYDETNGIDAQRRQTTTTTTTTTTTVTTSVESSDDSDEDDEDDDDDGDSSNNFFSQTPSTSLLSNSNNIVVDQVKQDALLPSNITSNNINQFRPIHQQPQQQQQSRPITYYPTLYSNQQPYSQPQQTLNATATVPLAYPRQLLSSRRHPLPTPIPTTSSCSCSHRTPNTSTVITPSNSSNSSSTTSISPFILYPPNQTPNVLPTLAATTQQTVALAAAASAGK